VVDDAIVVIENVQRHISEGDNDTHHATSVAMGEVTSAVIATSLVLISVFVPSASFRDDGYFVQAVLADDCVCHCNFSVQRALTLSPAPGGILLRQEQHHGGLLKLIDNAIKASGVGTRVSLRSS